jgi:hypothetical protein
MEICYAFPAPKAFQFLYVPAENPDVDSIVLIYKPWGFPAIPVLRIFLCLTCDSRCQFIDILRLICYNFDRLCGLVVRVLGYRSGGPGSIPGTNKKKVVDLERGPLSLVGTTEELLDRKVAAPV